MTRGNLAYLHHLDFIDLYMPPIYPSSYLICNPSFAEIPKVRQLESLRPFLIEYDLFDPKRNPYTAPIELHVSR